MKSSSEYSKRLKKLFTRLKKEIESQEENDASDSVAELLLGALTEYTSENRGKAALGRLHGNFVDYNELRVARLDEVMEVLGKGFPRSREVAQRVTGVLREIYDTYDCLDLKVLEEMGKREARAELDKMEHTTSYMSSRVMLRSMGAHAFPLDERILDLLRREEVIDPEAEAEDVQSFLERQISASQIRKIYPLLRDAAEDQKTKKTSKRKTSKKTKRATKTKKTVKKKTTKRKT